MLSWFAPRVEVLEVKEDRVIFRSPRSLRVGRPQPVKLEVPGVGLRSLRVSVQSVRPLDRGGYACSARLEGEVPALTGAPSAAATDAALRRAVRFDCKVRVLSPQLPGFRAVTLDFSHGGIQVEAEGELSAGQVLNLTLEFDRAQFSRLQCQARVAWCSQQGRARYRAGLQFVTPSPEVERQLASIESFLLSRETSSVLQRSLAQDPGPDSLPQTSREDAPRHFPLSGQLEAYCKREGRLTVHVLQGDQRVELSFPSLFTMRDYSGDVPRAIHQLRESSGSELVSQATRRTGQGGWRHYQLLTEEGDVVLEVVSLPAGRPGVLTPEQLAQQWDELWKEIEQASLSQVEA